MKINGLKITRGILLNKKITPLGYTPSNDWINDNPEFDEGENDFAQLDITLLVEGNTEDEFENNLSCLSKDLRKCILEFEDLNLEYICSKKSNAKVEMIIQNHAKVTFSFDCYSRSKLKTIEINQINQDIYIEGNMPCNVIYELTSHFDKVSFKINDIEIKNLKKDKTIIIDGIKGKILEDGNNKFLDTNIFSFPKINPGQSSIRISDTNVTLKLKYYARYY